MKLTPILLVLLFVMVKQALLLVLPLASSREGLLVSAIAVLLVMMFQVKLTVINFTSFMVRKLPRLRSLTALLTIPRNRHRSAGKSQPLLSVLLVSSRPLMFVLILRLLTPLSLLLLKRSFTVKKLLAEMPQFRHVCRFRMKSLLPLANF